MQFFIPLLLLPYMTGRLHSPLLLLSVLPVFHGLNCCICEITLVVALEQRGQNLWCSLLNSTSVCYVNDFIVSFTNLICVNAEIQRFSTTAKFRISKAPTQSKCYTLVTSASLPVMTNGNFSKMSSILNPSLECCS